MRCGAFWAQTWYCTVLYSYLKAAFIKRVDEVQLAEKVNEPEIGKLLVGTRRDRKLAASQDDDELKAWLLHRRSIQQMQMDFWLQYSQDMDECKLDLCKEVESIFDNFAPEIVDMLKLDWVDDILDWKAARVEKKVEPHLAESQDRVTPSEIRVSMARPRYHRFFNAAAGRGEDDGPPGATCEQPKIDGSWQWSDDEWLAWWLDLGGFGSCNQQDDNGWTPLHHCVEAMVHWDQAWKIGVTLIDKMEVQWLRAKTERGQPPPPHRTALHMMSCNSDRAVRKPELVVLLANKLGDVDPTDDQGRTPLMHAVGTGLLNVAKALVDARADPFKRSDDGRTLANRCAASSGSVKAWVEKLGVQKAGNVSGGRYRPQDHVSLSRQARYSQAMFMDQHDMAVSQEEAANDASPEGGGGGAAASSSDAAPAASSAQLLPERPRMAARATPTNPIGPKRNHWAWYWDDRSQKWKWYWSEVRQRK